MSEFKHPLCQNDKKWEGYTVFKLEFNDVPVEFVTLVDAKHILEKARKSQKVETRATVPGRQIDAIGEMFMVISGLLWKGFTGECGKRVPCYILQGAKGGKRSFDNQVDGIFLCDLLDRYVNQNISISVISNSQDNREDLQNGRGVICSEWEFDKQCESCTDWVCGNQPCLLNRKLVPVF